MATSDSTTPAQLPLSFEEWRPVVGYEGLYEVSNLGRVRSLDRIVMMVGRWRHPYKGRLLRQGPVSKKWLRVQLCREGKIRSIRVHHLVLEAFVGPAPLGYQTNHRNGRGDDNRVDNLEWVTTQENTRHAIEIGLRDFRGEKSSSARLMTADVYRIRLLARQGLYAREIAAQFGVSREAVSAIVHRRTWKHLPEE